MTDPDRRHTPKADAEDRDGRSDIEQAVEARADAVKRGDGGDPDSPDAMSGEGGTDGVVKNQEDAGQ